MDFVKLRRASKTRPVLSQYLTTIYPPGENYGYRYLLDICVAWLGSTSLERALQEREPEIIRKILFMVDAAAWFCTPGCNQAEGRCAHARELFRAIRLCFAGNGGGVRPWV